MAINRRTAIGLAGLGVIASRIASAQHQMQQLAVNPQNYKLQFFTDQENAVLDRVAEMIVPADDHSVGAHEARVSYHIDLVVANSKPARQAEWKSRLQAFENQTLKSQNKAFLDLDPADQAAVLNVIGARERHPSTPVEHLFADMKAAIFAYYSTRIGLLNELDYAGNRVLSSFPGCSHGHR